MNVAEVQPDAIPATEAPEHRPRQVTVQQVRRLIYYVVIVS